MRETVFQCFITFPTRSTGDIFCYTYFLLIIFEQKFNETKSSLFLENISLFLSVHISLTFLHDQRTYLFGKEKNANNLGRCVEQRKQE